MGCASRAYVASVHKRLEVHSPGAQASEDPTSPTDPMNNPQPPSSMCHVHAVSNRTSQRQQIGNNDSKLGTNKREQNSSPAALQVDPCQGCQSVLPLQLRHAPPTVARCPPQLPCAPELAPGFCVRNSSSGTHQFNLSFDSDAAISTHVHVSSWRGL